MLSASTRSWANWPLTGFFVAAAIEAVHLFLFPVAGVLDAAMELGALACATAAGILALKGLAAALGDLERSHDSLADLVRTTETQAEIIQGAGEAIIVIDDQATVVSFNRAAERMFGYSAGEMIGTSLERLMTEGGRQAHAAYLAQTGVTAMVEAARLRTVHKGVRKRGDVFTFELSMTEWASDGHRMFTGVMRDVTHRERAADAARESDARFTELFEAVGDPLIVFALGADGGFVLESMNAAAEEAVGASRFAARGATPDSLGKDEGRALKRALLDVLSTREPLDAEAPLLIGGRARTLPLALAPMRNGSGEIERILVRLKKAPEKARAGKAA
jgi:PAS domain S-box-containing protein